MKLTGKILIFAGIASFVGVLFSSCEKEYYKDELYRKEIYIVSGDDNIFEQEYSFGGSTGYLSIYAGGVTPIDQDVTVELAIDHEALAAYNKRAHDTDYGNYLQALDPRYYTIENPTVVLKVGSSQSYATCPIEVTIDELLVDSEYAIPIRIETVSGYMASKTKDYVLYKICMENEYATTKTDTYYTMVGSSQEGRLDDYGYFWPEKDVVGINMSKIAVPVSKRTIRIMPAATMPDPMKFEQTKYWAIAVTVDPIQTVDVPVLDYDGNPTDEIVTMMRVSLNPWINSHIGISVEEIGEKPSYYDPETKTFVLNYRYHIDGEDNIIDEFTRIPIWYEIMESMTDTRLQQ